MRVPTWLRITAALWAAVFLFIVLTLPPATRELAEGLPAPYTRRGAFHVHTVASDGGGTREDVARAAARAGLDFVILTDHGDGTAEPAAPEYLHGVLVIDGVEVTTSAGHYATFGASRSPYPLGGPAYAVVEDIARLGGFGVAAHPDSAKADLRWRDWTARINGLEWINGDSAWRDERPMTLARGILDYLFRPGPALAALVDRPSRLLQRMDDLSRTRHIVGLAAADAHARLPLTDDSEPYESRWTVPAPSYEQSFKTFVNLVHVSRPASGDARRDAASIGEAIRAGNVAFAMTALAAPAALHFSVQARFPGRGSIGVYPMGSLVPAAPEMIFEARTPDVVESGRSLVRLTLLRDGRVAATAEGPVLSHRVEDARGIWRIEGTLATWPDVPWLLSNPIKVNADAYTVPGQPGDSSAPAPDPVNSLELTAGQWAIEHHPESVGSIAPADGGQVFSYRLAGGAPAGQYAAAVRATGSTQAWDSLVLTARAAAPVRVWIQLRLSDSRTGQRWGHSVYLDDQSRTVRIPIRDFAPLEPRPSVSRPNVVQVRQVLIVVDTVNTAPGGAGRITLEGLRLVGSRPANQ
ncbi:MAG: hypothetical protein WD690_07590 [Vicinamibacterales bacterium]